MGGTCQSLMSRVDWLPILCVWLDHLYIHRSHTTSKIGIPHTHPVRTPLLAAIHRLWLETGNLFGYQIRKETDPRAWKTENEVELPNINRSTKVNSFVEWLLGRYDLGPFIWGESLHPRTIGADWLQYWDAWPWLNRQESFKWIKDNMVYAVVHSNTGNSTSHFQPRVVLWKETRCH